MKEIIDCDKNDYQIQQIELGNVPSGFYVKFCFSDEKETKHFRAYLRSTMGILLKEESEPIQFQELKSSETVGKSCALIGNIKQAVDILKENNIFSDKTKQILDDSEETGIQKILKNSQKCTHFIAKQADEKTYTDLNFFISKSSEKEHKEGHSDSKIKCSVL